MQRSVDTASRDSPVDEHLDQGHRHDGHSHDGHGGSCQPVPSEAESPSRAARMALPLGLAAATLCGCIAVAAADPGDDGAPLCWSRAVFGVDCPFCGGLRATNALLRGNFAAAADHNVMLAVAMPVAVLMWVWWTWKSWRGEPLRGGGEPVRSPIWISIVAGLLLVAFGVVRNFSGSGWMRWLYSDTYLG